MGGIALAPSMVGCGQQSKTEGEEQAEGAGSIEQASPAFQISLAQWSLHKAYFGDSLSKGWAYFSEKLQSDPGALLTGDLNPMDFAVVARNEFGIDAIEYVNTFYFGKAKNMEVLKELKNKAANEGVSSQLIMCDAEGQLGDPDEAARTTAVENHYKWVDAAAFLGCHSIRVNASSEGTNEEQMKLAADGLRSLCEYADGHNINVLVENHGGISSNAQWLTGVMDMVDHPRVGTLPDFGNFSISETEEYDRYKGIEELMPYAKAVSAKSHAFDADGNESGMDYHRIMDIVVKAGYHGYVGIEYEGDVLSEFEGIKATKNLLERILKEQQG